MARLLLVLLVCLFPLGLGWAGEAPAPQADDEYADIDLPDLPAAPAGEDAGPIFDGVCTDRAGGAGRIHAYPDELSQQYAGANGAHRMKEALKIVGNYLAVDGNRDGSLTFDTADRKTANHPWRWWINDDKDEANVDIDSGADVPGSGSNGTDGAVNGRRDLVDFFPVGIDLNGLRQAFPPSDGYTLQLRQADGAVNVVPVNHVVGSAFDYLTQEQDGGYGSGFGQAARSASVTTVTSAGVAMPAEIIQLWQSNNASAVMLVEGRGVASRPLELVVVRGDMSMVAGRIELSISPVEEMYRWVNLRGVVHSGGLPSRLESPHNMPDDECSDVTVVWVHGYNVAPDPARSWIAESYKRLYQSRMKARFAGVTWAGDLFNGQWFGVSKYIAADYHLAVENAFKTGDALALAVPSLPGRKVLISHSLGAGVVGGAIQNAGLVDYSHYIAVDAAMPKEAYDEFAPIDAKMIPCDGSSLHDFSWHNDNYTNTELSSDAINPRLWASYWYKLFSPSVDSRSGLAWRGRLEGVTSKMYNMYSSGEEVLRNSDGTWPDVLTETPSGIKAWQSQEWLKGNRSVLNVIFEHNAHGGWGYNTRHRISTGPIDEVVGGQYRYPTIEETWIPLPVTTDYLFEHLGYVPPMGDRVAAELNTLTPSGLIREPFFRRFDVQETLGSINDPGITVVERNRILAQAVPATTFAAGANSLDVVDNFNMDTIRSSGSWPSGPAYVDHQRWFHSDIKDVAYLYVHPAFEHILDIGAAR